MKKLRKLARYFHIHPTYIDFEGKNRSASNETLLATLEVFCGRIPSSDAEVARIIEERREEIYRRTVPPTLVRWRDLGRNSFWIIRPEPLKSLKLAIHGKEIHEDFFSVEEHSPRIANSIRFYRYRVNLTAQIDLGYYELHIDIDGEHFSSQLICAPLRLGRDYTHRGRKLWGLFAPLYGLGEKDQLMGDLASLEEMQEFVWKQGGNFVGTLPILAADYDSQDYDASPYSACSRLFWNDIYLPIDRILEEMDCPAIKKKWEMEKSDFVATARKEDERWVDHHRIHRLRKAVLVALAAEFFERGLDQQPQFLQFLQQSPLIGKYLEYRKAGTEEEKKYHLFVQFQMQQFLERLKAKGSQKQGALLYLDFPIGIAGHSFDGQVYPSDFIKELSVGAPPDEMFRGGQNWGFPPFHPEQVRIGRYVYFRQALAQHMRVSHILRFDHVMGLARVYVYPRSNEARVREGVYLGMPSEDFFAVSCLEAHRHQVDFIGENLGTVPENINQTLQRHDLTGMWVAQMNTQWPAETAIKAVTENTLANINTHDFPMFRAFVEGLDMPFQKEVGVVTEDFARMTLSSRAQQLKEWMEYYLPDQNKDGEDFYRALAVHLASSTAKYVMYNVEDFWGETEPQNIPGTWREYPNWRRRLKFPVKKWSDLASSVTLCREIALRRQELMESSN